ncbi:hypothetical protein BDA99DRAFT_531047 [Phascolomyces articulosus]|uniref:Uncharacterized protein n=1 Tax=Phascolomyces articulosus TaxID=60185 RepID=A0AAD5PM06_9FUNG|nr:hypothetical protein BDA99DRAFT_531047 [Phascolomyces articulosus]
MLALDIMMMQSKYGTPSEAFWCTMLFQSSTGATAAATGSTATTLKKMSDNAMALRYVLKAEGVGPLFYEQRTLIILLHWIPSVHVTYTSFIKTSFFSPLTPSVYILELLERINESNRKTLLDLTVCLPLVSVSDIFELVARSTILRLRVSASIDDTIYDFKVVSQDDSVFSATPPALFH